MLLKKKCKECDGSGIKHVEGATPFVCFNCNGKGKVLRKMFAVFFTQAKRRQRKPEQDWRDMKRMLKVYAELELVKYDLREQELNRRE